MRHAIMGTVLLIGWSVAGGLEAADATLKELIEAVQAGEATDQVRAIDALGLLGPAAHEAVPALARQLRNDAPLVRAHAADALGRVAQAAESKAAVDALAQGLSDTDPVVRRESLDALRRLRPSAEFLVPALSKLLADAEPAVRVRALALMTDLGEPAVPTLVKALDDEEQAYWATLALAEMGAEARQAVPALIKTLDQNDPDVARQAAVALSAIVSESEDLDAATRDNSMDALTAALDRPERSVRLAAIYGLGQIGPAAKKSRDRIEAVKTEDAPMLAAVRAWTLARMNPQDEDLATRATQQLARMLVDESPRARHFAARALDLLEASDRGKVEIIRKTLDDASAEEVARALDALSQIGAVAVPRLVAALEQNQEIQPMVARILGRLGTEAKEAAPALAALLASDNAETRREAAFALAALGEDAAVALPALQNALDDSDRRVTHAASYALGRIGPQAASATEQLAQNLRSENQPLQVISAWALVHIAPQSPVIKERAMPVLEQALQGGPSDLRAEAARTLRLLGPRAAHAVPALKQAAEDKDREVRQAAAEALAAIEKPVAAEPASQPK